MDAIGDWVGEHDPGATAVPFVLPAFTDCRWWRAAFPDCVAYGFFPMRHQTHVRVVAADARAPTSASTSATSASPPPSSTTSPGGSLPVPEDKLRLGGMALRNGLLVHGPSQWAAAVRAKDGSVKVASGPKPRVYAFDDIPGVRGLVRLGEAFAVIPLVKRGLPEAKLAFENPSVIGVAAAASIAGALIKRRAPGAGGEVSVGADRPRAGAVRAARRRARASTTASSTRRSPPTRPTTRTRPTRQKEHERCGSHLMAPMLAANLAGTLLLKRAMERPTPLAGGAVALASTAAAVEVFAWSERHADSPLSKALKRPGYEIQRIFGTREPDERQLEVGRAALAEILRVERPTRTRVQTP